MNYQRANLIFDWDNSSKHISNLKLNSTNFDLKFQQDLLLIEKNQGHPYSLKHKFFFPVEIETSLNEFFEAIKEIKNKDNDNVLAAYLASYIYQKLAGFWNNDLLKNGLSISFCCAIAVFITNISVTVKLIIFFTFSFFKFSLN